MINNKREKNKRWKLIREVIIERDRGCVICGDTNRINIHHIIPKENSEYYFDELNLIALCPKHHRFLKKGISAHQNSMAFYIWLQINRPKQFRYLKKIILKEFIK